MKFDVIFCGVGGQGILSITVVMAMAAMYEDLIVKQTETHGMAQRGGSVSAHLRISDLKIHSNLIPFGSAELLLSMEPLEALRNIDYLDKNGVLISSNNQFNNIANYPDINKYYEHPIISSKSKLIDVMAMAKRIGVEKAANMILVGAASIYFPMQIKAIEYSVEKLFYSKGKKAVEDNLKAFYLGRELLLNARNRENEL